MLYLLLIVIIVLLVILIYRTRNKGAYFNKIFKPVEGIKKFDINDSRNQTHPNEYVKFQLRNIPRSEAVKEYNRLHKLYTDTNTDPEDINKILN